jgi:hypothetical protein
VLWPAAPSVEKIYFNAGNRHERVFIGYIANIGWVAEAEKGYFLFAKMYHRVEIFGIWSSSKGGGQFIARKEASHPDGTLTFAFKPAGVPKLYKTVVYDGKSMIKKVFTDLFWPHFQ